MELGILGIVKTIGGLRRLQPGYCIFFFVPSIAPDHSINAYLEYVLPGDDKEYEPGYETDLDVYILKAEAIEEMCLQATKITEKDHTVGNSNYKTISYDFL